MFGNLHNKLTAILAGVGAALLAQSAGAENPVPYSAVPSMTLTTPGTLIRVKANTVFSYQVTQTDQDTYKYLSSGNTVTVNDGDITCNPSVNSMQAGFAFTAGGQNASGAIQWTLSGVSLNVHAALKTDSFQGIDPNAENNSLTVDSSVGASQQVYIS